MEKGGIGNDAAFSMRNVQQLGGDPIRGNWNAMNTRTNGDDEYVRKLNPYLIDPSGHAASSMEA
jgi:hypothetical protein